MRWTSHHYSRYIEFSDVCNTQTHTCCCEVFLHSRVWRKASEERGRWGMARESLTHNGSLHGSLHGSLQALCRLFAGVNDGTLSLVAFVSSLKPPLQMVSSTVVNPWTYVHIYNFSQKVLSIMLDCVNPSNMETFSIDLSFQLFWMAEDYTCILWLVVFE